MRRPAGPTPSHSYEGQFLIAMPSLRDGPFARSVVYMCAHRSDGAMGIVINQRAQDIQFAELLVQLEIVRQPDDTGRGFVLHSSDYRSGDSTVKIAEGVCLTATLDILKAIAQGAGPQRAVLALGCAGWASGQLESEILANAWLVGPVDAGVIFDSDFSAKYDRALALLGASAASLSGEAGHA